MKRKSWWCLIILVGLVTAGGCAKEDIPSSDEREENVPKKNEPGLVYDAAAVSRILGLPCESSDPVPQAKDGEVIIYYGGWDMKTLRASQAGQKRMLNQDWCEKYEWKAKPGYYRLLLPVPGSNQKTWNGQVAYLRTIDEAWQPAPVSVAATALLIHLMETGDDLLKDNWCLCAEVLPSGCHVALGVRWDRVSVCGRWGDHPSNDDFLGAARKVP